MANVNARKNRHPRQRWGKSSNRFIYRLFCCSCLHSEKDRLHDQEKKINEGRLHPHLNEGESGERKTIQITVEDLGIVNTSFSLMDEDPLAPRNSMARSASSVSACRRNLKKKRLKALSSLPIQLQVQHAAISREREGEDDEQEDEDLMFECGTDSSPASDGLLTPPIINLIPPTPSDVVDDDQFFDNNSEESEAHTSGSYGSFAAGDQEIYEENVEEKKSTEGFILTEKTANVEIEAEPEEYQSDVLGEHREAVLIKKGENDERKPKFLWSAYQVTPLHEYPKKRGFTTGISLLSFAENDLDDLNNRDLSCSDMLKAELCFLTHQTTMDALTHQKRPITRSCSLGDNTSRSANLDGLTQTADQPQEGKGLLRQRRITVASYMPHTTDQNGNFSDKDVDTQVVKSLSELNTEEICQWFTSIGLQKCLPFIRDGKLCGADIASVDANTLDTLHIISLEDREHLLSAIYNELHPPSTITQTLDSLLESLGPNNVETFTATLLSMTKSKSSPHVNCLSMNRRSLKLRNLNQNHLVQKNCQMIEITIHASQRIIHLRTPKETTVGKIMDSCIKMLGTMDNKSLFTLKEKQDSPEELSPDQQIGNVLTPTSEIRQLELHLCKMDKPTASQNSQEVQIVQNGLIENGNINKNIQGDQLTKEERIRELNQQVASLQSVVLQVQELHQSLVAFCSELKNMDADVNLDKLGSVELKRRLEIVNSQLNDKRESLQTLRDDINNSTAHKKKQLEVCLLEKMKLNCRVFKEEIFIVHLNRQVAHLQNALKESCTKEKAQKETLAIGCLSQLVSPQSPAMLIVVQENQSPDGHYGFTCHHRDGSGLVVVKVDNSQLCVHDRLVEVNGVPVVNSSHEELNDLLLQGTCAEIVVLRQPPPILGTPLLLQHMLNPDPVKAVCSERDVVTMETPPQCKMMAI